jgi:hypothetical protein
MLLEGGIAGMDEIDDIDGDSLRFVLSLMGEKGPEE